MPKIIEEYTFKNSESLPEPFKDALGFRIVSDYDKEGKFMDFHRELISGIKSIKISGTIKI